MEIQTHVLTNPQNLDAGRQQIARENITAAKKPTNTSVDNLAGFDSEGEIVDTGVAKADLVHDANYVHTDNNYTDADKNKLAGITGYVKDAVVTEDGKKLTLTKSDDSHVDFMGGSGLPTPTQDGDVLTVVSGQAAWAEPSHVDVSGKMDKVQEATENNLVAFDDEGNAKDSEIATSDVSNALSKLEGISAGANKVEESATNGNIKIDNVETEVYAHPTTEANAAAARTVGNDALGHVVLGEPLTKGDVGLGNVDNTSDLNKPISTDTQSALNDKVDKVEGKGLSTEDYTTAEKTKLGSIDAGAQVNVIETVKVNGTALTPDENKAVNIDLSGYKTKQSAVVDPSAVDTGLTFIDSASQDANGVMTVTKRTVQDGTTSQKGVVQLVDSHESTATDKAATPKNVKEAYDLASGKQDPIVFDGTYDPVTNKAATVATVTSAVANKADKVSSATNGNFAGLDSNGNLTDSHKKAEDFATAAQGEKADSAIQGVKLNGSTLTPDSAKVVDLGDLKTKQLYPVNDPNAGNNDGLTFIKHVAQNENGNLTTLTSATVQDGTTSQKGVVQLQDSIAAAETSVTTAPTPRAVREAIANAVASAYHHAGTKVVADLTSSLLVAENEGCVYNMTDAGTTTADFIEGADKPIRIGDNVGVCKVSSNPDTYKFDLLSGFVDLSNYKTKQQVKSSPTKNGESVEYIDTISQDANGEITATKKGIPLANTSQVGLVKLSETVADNHTTAATPACVKQAYDLADSAVKGVQKNGTDITLDANKKANVIVNNAKLKIQLGSSSVTETGFTADADNDATITVPLADYSGSTYTEGLMTGQEKEKLAGIASGAEVNSIESITIEDDQSALPINQENVTIPKAAYTTGATPTYTTGVITGQDKKKLDEIEDGAQENDIENIKIEGESSDLTITSKRVTLPLAASATTSPVAAATPGIMSASDKAKLDGIEASADVNVIEGVKLEGDSDVLTPDQSTKVVTIPDAAADTSGSTPVYTHGLMSAADKEKLDTLKNFSKVTISDGATPTPSTADCDPSNDHDTLTFEAGHNITLAKAANANKITITASADPVTVSAGAGIEINQTPIVGGGTDYEVGVKGGHMGYLIDTSISHSHIKSQDDILQPESAANPISDSGDDRFIIHHDANDGHTYLCALKPIPASGNDPAVAGVELFTLSVNANVEYSPRGNGYYYRGGVNVYDVGNGVTLSQSVETYPSQVGEGSIDQTLTIKNTSTNTVTIDGKEYCRYRVYYSGESDTTQDDPAGNVHVALVAHVSAMEIAVGIIERNGNTLAAGEAISLANDLVSVKHGDGLGLDTNGDLTVKLGNGLKFDTTGSATVITLDNPTEAVVQAVQKMENDLDCKLTTNFAMPQIVDVYDFASRSVSTLSIGACMLCQAFTVPINNGIRLESGTETPTLFGIYAKQSFGHKIMLALYVYDFNTGSTDYVADTGPVDVVAGRNEFPIKHINPNITELKSDCVYYATLYLPSAACVNGLFLCGCPSYQAASQINAIPRFTVGVDNITYNGAEISMASADTGRLDYNDGNGHYYIGPWSSTYNEHPNAPRFFMQIRNAAGGGSVATDPFVNIPTGFNLEATNGIVAVFQSATITLSPDGNDLVMQLVKPAKDVTIKSWTFYDTNSGDSNNWGARVYNSGLGDNVAAAQGTGTITASHNAVSGTTYYAHTYSYGTNDTGLKLTAGSSYWFPAGVAFDGNDKLVQYTSATTVKKDLIAFDNGANVPYNYVREDDVQGTFLQLVDSNGNTWTI